MSTIIKISRSKKRGSTMQVYTSDDLKEFITRELQTLATDGVRHSRFCKADLDTFLHNSSHKVCGIYGLRRTGKTTLMYQTISEMDCNNVVFMKCTPNDSYVDIENVIQNVPQTYIFIDEITKADGFIRLSSSLYDDYPTKKIVIAGTDSAAMLFAKEDELFDRIDLIHTTYISFAEFHYLLGKSLDDYIRYGGTLTDGAKIYNEDSLAEYTNTAIVSNICKSVEVGGRDIPHRRLYDLYISGMLESVINKTIERQAREFSLNVVQGVFSKSNNFGSAKDLTIQQDIPKEDKVALANWKDHTEVCRYISEQLRMQPATGIKESDFELMTKFLMKLDVLSKKPNGEIFFTQCGMQYCFAEILINNIVHSMQFRKLFQRTQTVFLEKLHQDAVGHILENVIQTDVMKCPALSKMETGKADDIGNGEFDFYILNPNTQEALIYEIKRSSVIVPKQYRHLANQELCNDFERLYQCKIIGKSVLYQGKPQMLDNGICYQNISDFLLHIEDATKCLVKDTEKDKDMNTEKTKNVSDKLLDDYEEER
ncbi:ATP-binding protein [Lachnospiraceae bacterium YH-ros2226]